MYAPSGDLGSQSAVRGGGGLLRIVLVSRRFDVEMDIVLCARHSVLEGKESDGGWKGRGDIQRGGTKEGSVDAGQMFGLLRSAMSEGGVPLVGRLDGDVDVRRIVCGLLDKRHRWMTIIAGVNPGVDEAARCAVRVI